MFLNTLGKIEKENFLELAYFVANSNGDFADEERAMIEEYRNEMNLGHESYTIKNMDVNEILEELSKSDSKIRNTIFFEILALILSDSKYDDEEKRAAELIRNKLGISSDKQNEMVRMIESLMDTYRKINELITV